MGSAALDLKSEREKKKVSLAQIAADTRISLRYLQSIEEGRYSDLPGGVYNRAFLKAYCESINIDPREILEHYDAQASSALHERHPKAPHIQPPRKTFPAHSSILIWSIMLLISAIGIFFSRGWISDLFSPYFSEKPSAVVPYEASSPPPTPSDTPASALPDDASISEGLSTGETSPAVDPVPVELGSSPEKTAAPPMETTDNSLKASTQPDLRLEISAQEPCWISVDSDGIPITRKVLEPGETQLFNARERLRITIGNAGGIRMKINDKPSRTLGKTDEVIRMNIVSNNYQQFIDQPAG